MDFTTMMQLEERGDDVFLARGPQYPWGGLYGGQPGMSAVLLPHRSSTEIDWPAFEVHVDRTAAAGLTPAAKHGHGLRAPPQPRAVAEVLRRTKVLGVDFVACRTLGTFLP